ncbi:hypothetical protein BaRGS_00013768 [Batillaria attramentaria]|uniref:Uncharacterized protein n=1 Tax=Batillaria attramentaria TaxID=370345 RepID=A0ABD0L761_9CAEN
MSKPAFLCREKCSPNITPEAENSKTLIPHTRGKKTTKTTTKTRCINYPMENLEHPTPDITCGTWVTSGGGRADIVWTRVPVRALHHLYTTPPRVAALAP